VNGGKNLIANEAFLKALKRIHVNTAHIANTPGYTDAELYARYPLKYFNKLTPFETYDTDAMLPRIHAVEFLGEPQYGGGHPVPPQKVWTQLHPYACTRLATSLTNSEERVWRDYAGLSDFPHYDAYRVTAPRRMHGASMTAGVESASDGAHPWRRSATCAVLCAR